MSKGSVFQRGQDGYWVAQLQVKGKRRTVHAKTKTEAQRKRAELKREIEHQVPG